MKKFKLALLAQNIHKSVTPLVYNHYAKSLGYDIEYDIFNIEPNGLEDFVGYARENLQGFTVTMPYKQAILKFVDGVDESAKNCSSSNTVKVADKKLTAYNTDGWGFVKALSIYGADVKGKKVVMVGAGGVAVSIAYNLSISGIKAVDVLNVHFSKARDLCERSGDNFTPYGLAVDTLKECCRGADIFVNASVLGQVGFDDYEDTGFLDSLPVGAVVFDVNYSKPDARLLRAAREKGFKAISGKSMVACQGIKAMGIWTGTAPGDDAALKLIESFK